MCTPDSHLVHPYLASSFIWWIGGYLKTRNRKHRRAAAKPAACAKPLMLSKVGSQGGRAGE